MPNFRNAEDVIGAVAGSRLGFSIPSYSLSEKGNSLFAALLSEDVTPELNFPALRAAIG